MQNSLTRALIDGPALLAPLRGVANVDALARPALRLVWSADDRAAALRLRQDETDPADAIDDLLIF